MTDINTPGGWNDGLKTRLEGLSPEDKAKLLEMLKQDEELKQSNEKKENEDLDLFRKDLLEHFYVENKRLSSKIKKLWDKLIENGDFYFEDTEYGKVWILRINWNEYRFLSMCKINEDLLQKYDIDKDKIKKDHNILWKKWYLSDVINIKYMPWWTEEDEWIKRMVDDISHNLWLSTVNQKFMKEFWDEVMKVLGEFEDTKNEDINWNISEKWLYLYAYLMWPASLWSAFLNDSKSHKWEENRGNLAIHTSKDGVSPYICVLPDYEIGCKLFFASKKSINEW